MTGRSRPGFRRSPWLAVLAALLIGACGYQGLSFFQDHRLDIVAPENRAELELPITIEWTIDGFETSSGEGDGDGYFAVFIDRAPQAPGKTIESIAEDDPSCDIDPLCPSDEYFATRGVHTTRATSLTIDHIPGLASSDRRDIHEASVILLDADGHRIGESVWRVEFRVEDEDAA